MTSDHALPAGLSLARPPARGRGARKRRFVPPPLRAPIPPAQTGPLDRAPPLLLLACAAMISGAVHLAGLGAASGLHRDAPPPEPRRLRVTVVEKPVPAPPPPVVQPQPEIPKTVPLTRPKHRVAMTETPPPPQAPPEQPPPPPTHDVPGPPSKTPVLIAGMSLSSTTAAGGLRVAVGNAPYGRGSGTPAGTGEGKPYKARQYAEPYALTEEPVFLDNVSAEEVRRFYPEEARKTKLEAVVLVKLTIDDDGSVVRVSVVSDPGNGFGAAAAKLARLYRFKPAKVNGQAVATQVSFKVHFELDR